MNKITNWLQIILIIILIVVAITVTGQTYFLNQRLDKIGKEVQLMGNWCTKELERLEGNWKSLNEELAKMIEKELGK